MQENIRPRLKTVERKDLNIANIDKGETLIVLQRHADYDRNTGSLTSDGVESAKKSGRDLIVRAIAGVPNEELKNFYLLVVASPTEKNGGKRSVETAQIVIDEAREIFNQRGIDRQNILTQLPRESSQIEEPRIFKDDDLRFFFYMRDKYGKPANNPNFWLAYEDDVEREKRESLGAEGPNEIANRFHNFNRVLARYSRLFHTRHPDSRLLIANVSHYDTISPFIKTRVESVPLTTEVPVDYLAGVVVKINNLGEAVILNGDNTVEYDLTNKPLK